MSKFTSSFLSLTNSGAHFGLDSKSYYHSLCGRAINNAFDLSYEDVKALLWTAIELKTLHARCQPIPDVAHRWVALLMNQETYYLHAWRRAADLLSVKLTSTNIPDWESSGCLQDVRRFYSNHADLLLTKSKKHDALMPMYNPTQDTPNKIPLFNLGSRKCNLTCALTDFMTYQMHFGYLCGLNIITFGEPCPLINTYIPLCHLLSINIRYNTCHMTPMVLKSVLKEDLYKSEAIREYSREKDGNYKVDIVVVRGDRIDWKEISEKVQTYSQKMMVLRAFPQSDKIFAAPPPLFKERERHVARMQNLMYMMAAIMLRLLSNYDHQTPEPNLSNVK